MSTISLEAPAVDYRAGVGLPPQIVYINASNHGTTPTTLSLTANTQFVSLIPPVPFYPDKNELNFKISLPAPGTGTQLSWMNVMSPPIESIEIRGTNGVNLMNDARNLKYIYHFLTPALTSNEEYKKGIPVGIDVQQANFRALQSADDWESATGHVSQAGYLALFNGTGVGPTHVESPQVLCALTGLGSGFNNYEITIPLGQFKSTFCALRQCMYFDQELRFIVNFLPVNNWAFRSEAPLSFANAATLPSGITISDYQLRIATESNPAIKNTLVNQVNNGSGLQVWVPCLYSNKLPTSASTSLNETVRISQGGIQGQILQRVFVAVMNQEGSSLSASVTSCNRKTRGSVAGKPFWTTGLRTYQSGLPEQDAPLTSDDAFRYLKNTGFLNDTILNNVSTWEAFCFWCSDYTGLPGPALDMAVPRPITGKSLSERPFDYRVELTKSEAVAHDLYVVACILRRLTIKGGANRGFMLE